MHEIPGQTNKRINPRTTTPLNPRLDRNLFAYMAATGVGVMAASQSAEGKIIYTPANVTIISAAVPLDMNNDGTPDFMLIQGPDPYGSHLIVQPVGANAIKRGRFPGQAADAFFVPIGPHEPFAQSNSFMARFYSKNGYSFASGSWLHADNRYLGLQFVIQGTIHYGWARLNAGPFSAVLTGYAYEDIPQTTIKAGKVSGPAKNDSASVVDRARPVTPDHHATHLGILARGADGFTLWRRDPEEEGAGL